jgi:hypothetical protein
MSHISTFNNEILERVEEISFSINFSVTYFGIPVSASLLRAYCTHQSYSSVFTVTATVNLYLLKLRGFTVAQF